MGSIFLACITKLFFHSILNPSKRQLDHQLLVSFHLSQIAKSFWKHQNIKKVWWKCFFLYLKDSSMDSFDLEKQRKRAHWAASQLFQRFKNPSMRLENRIEHAWRIEEISSILQAVHQNRNGTHSKFLFHFSLLDNQSVILEWTLRPHSRRRNDYLSVTNCIFTLSLLSKSHVTYTGLENVRYLVHNMLISLQHCSFLQ